MRWGPKTPAHHPSIAVQSGAASPLPPLHCRCTGALPLRPPDGWKSGAHERLLTRVQLTCQLHRRKQSTPAREFWIQDGLTAHQRRSAGGGGGGHHEGACTHLQALIGPTCRRSSPPAAACPTHTQTRRWPSRSRRPCRPAPSAPLCAPWSPWPAAAAWQQVRLTAWGGAGGSGHPSSASALPCRDGPVSHAGGRGPTPPRTPPPLQPPRRGNGCRRRRRHAGPPPPLQRV